MLRIPLNLVIFVTSATVSATFAMADQNLQMKQKLAAADAVMARAEKRIHETEVLQALDPDFK